MFPYQTLQAGIHGLEAAWAQFLNDGVQKRPAIAFPFEACFQRAAKANQLPLALLLAVARGESNFQPQAVSRNNAYGLMQIQWPGTARHLGITELSELYEPCTNVEAGARYLKQLLRRYQGNLHRALAAYNYGPARIATDGGSLPGGAKRYSKYIYRHLAHVLGRSDPSSTRRKLALMNFTRACRAAAYVEALQPTSPSFDVDWFQSASGGFQVVLSYEGDQDISPLLESAAHVKVPWTCEDNSQRHAAKRITPRFSQAASSTDRLRIKASRGLDMTSSR
jgi:hypothetical protein